MKTADLIPFILLELKESDKYGFELTKSIETKSNGCIVIKQPTLYTVLKKLEKSKFITSYWEDSEIGGKRHYYKITENGLLQTSTFPSYSELLKNITNQNDFNESEVKTLSALDIPANNNLKEVSPSNSFSIFDHLATDNDEKVEVKESVLPSNEVFADSNIDNSTELDVNMSNAEILKSTNELAQTQFANNKDVSKFTETISTEIPTNAINQDLLNVKFNDLPEAINVESDFDNVEYVDYVELKKDPSFIATKLTIKHSTMKMIACCSYLLMMIIACSVVVGFTGATPLFFISQIVGLVCLLIVPSVYVSNYKERKQYLQTKGVPFSKAKLIILNLFVIGLVVLSCLLYNEFVAKLSLSDFVSIKNFGNLYSPIILSSTLLLNVILIKKSNKSIQVIKESIK